ncbi:MAG: YdeI/OmpD-associated family protein [Solirubrobacteraceae bacterium]
MATRRSSGPHQPPELEIVEFADQPAWEEWLGEHHSDSPGAWLRIAKKAASVTTVAYPEVLESALCHGWIDGQRKPLDDTYFLQRFTPRGPRSKWSQVNRAKATALIAAERMHRAGLAQVKAAQDDGRWDAAYEPQSRATIPHDFRQALDQNPTARDFFATLTGSRRYAFLYRLHNVRSPERRAKRIADYLELLSDGKTLN